MHSERREQSEMMIDGVDEPDLRGHELVIAQLPERLATDGVIGDPPLRAREQGQKSRAIGARKIEAIIKFRLGDGEKLRCVRDSPARDESLIKARNGGQQFARAVRGDERDFARGKVFRSAAIAGTVRIRSPIRLSWMRRMFNRPLARPLHRQLVSVEQARAEMVPREIFHHPFPRREAHPLHDFRMIIEVLNRRRERIDIRRRNDDPLHAVLHHVARFARRDLRQPAGRRLVGDFRAAFALRGKT